MKVVNTTPRIEIDNFLKNDIYREDGRNSREREVTQ